MHKPKRFPLQITGADEDVPRLLVAGGPGCEGLVGFVARPREHAAVLVHQPPKGDARVWRGSPERTGTDAPGAVDEKLCPDKAIQLLRATKADPPPSRPSSLRGAWKGHLHCENGGASVKLERKVAAYGTLAVSSSAEGWTATFTRTGTWFTGPATTRSQRVATLADAVAAGLRVMMPAIAEACSSRDTQQRNRVDADYAAKHPPRQPAAPRRDASEAVAVRMERQASRPPPKPRPAKPPKPPRLEIVPPLADVPPVAAPKPGAIERVATATQQDAQAVVALAETHQGEVELPNLLKRTANLIRTAEALAASSNCVGKARKAALVHIQAASEAFEAARKAHTKGNGDAASRDLRHAAERVALAAARAAKACSQGSPPGPHGAAGRANRAPATAAKATRARSPGKTAAPSDADAARVDAILMPAFAAELARVAKQMMAEQRAAS